MEKTYDILDIVYEDYRAGKRDKKYPVYCVQCVSHKRGLEFMEELINMGFTYVRSLPDGYRHVLVNLELGRVAGIPMPCNFTERQMVVFESEFNTILQEYLKTHKIGFDSGTSIRC